MAQRLRDNELLAYIFDRPLLEYYMISQNQVGDSRSLPSPNVFPCHGLDPCHVKPPVIRVRPPERLRLCQAWRLSELPPSNGTP